MKIEIPSFSGNLDIESFLDWVYEVEKFFDIDYEKRVKFVTYKLKGGAAAWLDQFLISRRCHGKPLRDDMKEHEKNYFKVDYFHPTINKYFTINLNTVSRVQGLSRGILS